jgi:hypothetical protein
VDQVEVMRWASPRAHDRAPEDAPMFADDQADEAFFRRGLTSAFSASIEKLALLRELPGACCAVSRLLTERVRRESST